MTTEPSAPALFTICRVGSSSARITLRAPLFSSPDSSLTFLVTASIERRSATPPPGPMPSWPSALRGGPGGGPPLDGAAPAPQLAQPLLQLLPVVVGGRLLDLRPDLLDAAL